jgi:hypothetical protein
MSSTMTPAQRIIAKFDGEEAIAEALGITVPRVRRWTFPKTRGGTDGRVPSKHQQALLDRAKELGIKLVPADFFARKNPQVSPDQARAG